MNIGVTGHTGFIGKSLIKRLEGHTSLKLFDRQKHRLDDIKSLESFVVHTDCIFHLAGVKTDFENYRTNVLGTNNLLEAIRKFSPNTKMIFASSFAVYENTEKILTEEITQTKPVSHYGLSKRFAEELIEFYTRQYNIKSRILRIANVYGQSTTTEPSDIVSHIINGIQTDTAVTINGDGSQTRDFIYIDDVIDACVKTLSYNGNTLTVNICTGKKTSITTIFSMIEENLSRKAKVEYNKDYQEKGSWTGNPAKAQKLLGFTATIDLKTGIAKTIRGCRKNISL